MLDSAIESPISVHLTVVPFRSFVVFAIISDDVKPFVEFAVMTKDFVPTVNGAIFWLPDETSCDLLITLRSV